MGLKYKEGDRVRIKSLDWYNENKDEYDRISCGYVPFISKMSTCCGEVLTICDIKEQFSYYHMEECEYAFTDEMIEGLVEEEIKPKFKVGDKIKLKSTLFNDIFGVIGHEPEGYRITNILNGLTYFMSYSIEHYYELAEEEAKPKYEDEVTGEYYSTPKYLVRPSGYQFVDENGNVIHARKVVLEKKKKEKYPKTYEECSLINGCEDRIPLKIIGEFTRLINARNAYWKVYGEEKGLGKPWAPDWTNPEQVKYTIFYYKGGIKKDYWHCHGHILAFPTEEMMEEFYENFKKEIEMCKELL